ncbi:MAG: hypothetical protein K9K66_16565 [Desulfarculaceae bacterium]|nr:hypothetical protein [Desulfarculaceae bacterium]MCF8074137.1 hypothetical protein [Desulfarculaceae bacterium]MCF8103271.1 hypothetical protein [Desulfarculaceae bacterium]MCF8116871.1 hypothetical protein [Desulfarculaceae bacterium]
MLRKPLSLMLLAAALLLAAAPAAAHKVNIFAFVENGRLQGESYFPGGNKAQGCVVEVWDATGKKLAATKTDAKGGFSLPLPQGQPPYKVVLKAGQGHQADYSLNASELGLAPAPAAPSAPAAKSGVTVPPSLDRGASLGRAEMEQLLASLLQKELAPLKAQLARMSADQGVTVRDVLAGLGYILGLMGLAAYMHYRKQGKGK